MSKEQVSFEEIETFLEGRDPQKYIVSIEAPYFRNEVYLVINPPIEEGETKSKKRIETHTYNPFLWMKQDAAKYLYQGNRSAIKNGLKKHGLKITGLKVEDSYGNIPQRMEDGFKFMIKAQGGASFTDVINFVADGFAHMKENEKDKVDLYSQRVIPETVDSDNPKGTEVRSLFVAFTPTEQFFIQTGKRLFKGYEDYNELHRLQFDLETEGLDPSHNPIFQIGIRTNRGYEEVLEVKGDTEQAKRDSERIQIERFFDIITEQEPDVITGYNSENFDWPYLERRCERLSIDITEIAKTLNPKSKFRRKPSRIKLGSESVDFNQTLMWGYNILDISHAVRKTMAINSSIKSWSLKYITKFSSVAKENRVYVEGDKIHTTWADKDDYAFNDENGDFYKITDKNPLKEGYEIKAGDYIVQRYLQDDLWETEMVDGIYNQAAYLVAKLLPTGYMRSSTMGTAGQWKLIMGAWSYEKGIAIPATTEKRDFTGGLSRLLEVGYAEDVDKFDYAALYPKTQLTWDIFPDLDISGVMKGLLTYVVDTRDKFKFLTGKHKARAKELAEKLEEQKDTLDAAIIAKVKRAIVKEKKLASDYDNKQLPLKILANSFFGAYGAPYLFNWGDSDCAEETTCRGRQSLRLMVREFKNKWGFRPLVGDTDGFNFARPKSVNDYTYVATGKHWKTEGQGGKTLMGVEAVLAEFNETHMEGRMGLDLDDVCSSTINFSRKNYANAIDGKIKLVGNTVKSNKMPIYIEEFLDKGIKMLLDGDGHSFINYYYDYIDEIYNFRIPLVKIASKAKVKRSVDAYKAKMKTKNKSGGALAKQAHMELIIKAGIKVSVGDVIYYVNDGKKKGDSDVTSVKLKDEEGNLTGKEEIKFNCKLISREQIEQNPDLTTDEYNVAKYIEAFNKRIKPLLVCFHPDIRNREVEITSGKFKGTTKTVNNILIGMVKEKIDDMENLTKAGKPKKKSIDVMEKRREFTEKQCKLGAGHAFEDGDQDSYDDLMIMDDKEIRFWTSVDKLPNYMEQDEWNVIVADYKVRLAEARIQGIQEEKDRLDAIFQTLEIKELDDIQTYGVLPKMVEIISDLKSVNENEHYLVSRKWDVNLCEFNDIWRYEEDAKTRHKWYVVESYLDTKDRFELYQDHIASIKFSEGDEGVAMSATTETIIVVETKEELEVVAKTIMDAQDERHAQDIADAKNIEICQAGKCGGCEHCDGMGSDEAKEIEAQHHIPDEKPDDEFNF